MKEQQEKIQQRAKGADDHKPAPTGAEDGAIHDGLSPADRSRLQKAGALPHRIAGDGPGHRPTR